MLCSSLIVQLLYTTSILYLSVYIVGGHAFMDIFLYITVYADMIRGPLNDKCRNDLIDYPDHTTYFNNIMAKILPIGNHVNMCHLVINRHV